MKKIWNSLRHHIREDFNVGHYATVTIFLIISLTLNYTFNFEDDYLELMTGYPKFFAYLLFYCIAYFVPVFSFAIFNKQKAIFLRTDFWIKSLFGVSLLTLDSSAPFVYPLVNSFIHPTLQFWSYKVLVNSMSFFTVLLPISIFYYSFDKDQKHIYGLNPKRFDASPYYVMLLIMLPLIVAASFNESFLRQYPMYKTSGAHNYLGVSEWVTVLIYEIAYGLDFITVEYLFRGFMVIAMTAILGRGAVLSMAVLYCFLHFGKPAGEAISSILGGYILGVVAYETKSIWGGVIVHMGIAWMMELIAFVHKLFFQ